MLPFPLKPMLLQSTDTPFDSTDHIFEWKVDGIRGIMFYDRRTTRLQSRTGKDCTMQFPELLSPQVRADEAVFDGEIAVIIDGRPDFEGVMERYMSGSKRIETLSRTKTAIYIVWDILWLNRKSLMDRPLLERKAILENVLSNSTYIKKIDYVDTEGTLLWAAIKEHQLEGIVCKPKQSKYFPGRRRPFVKIKNFQLAKVNVFGYSRKDHSILVGTGDRVQGHAIGIHSQDRDVLWQLLREYGTDEGPAIFLPPGIRGRVKFTTLSTSGNMRDCCWEAFQI
ncbi:MAG: hypothetical protein JL50_08670 [Peptococcaceae bacterium BICA1-7]|nr:MAG: hypothetical protein JL50_08670 [Peptococcaceae bacterium BICA1-7]HBV97363.1 hypothetical protein [Desulfotomaculum sp.]